MAGIKVMKSLFALMLLLWLSGCATPTPYDYTEFKKSKPHSILVLPPLNNTPEVAATYAVYSQLTFPLAESGYYVFPVALVDETFRQNGVTNPQEIHALSREKLRSVFGADAALYVTVTQYGSTYRVFSSVTQVTLQAQLVDLKTGAKLWSGAATAIDDQGGNSGGGLIGLLVEAAVRQIVNNLSDASYGLAGQASQRMLWTHPNGGILPGPRYPVLPQAQ